MDTKSTTSQAQRQSKRTKAQGQHELQQYIYILSFHGLLWVCYMVFKATFNNITTISWRSVLLVEETGVPGENHRPVASSLTNFIT